MRVFVNIKILVILVAFIGTLSQVAWTQEQETRADKEFFFAQKLYEDKLYMLASEQFKEFSRNFASHERADDALFLAGESYFAAADYKNAFDAYKELELSYPQSNFLPEGRYRLAECQAALRNFAAAAELFRRVAVFHKESDRAPRALLDAANAYLKSGRHKSALSSLFEVISVYPDSPQRIDAHLSIVEIYLEHENYTETLNQIENVFRVFGPDLKDPKIYLLRARVFERLGQFDEALEIYSKIMEEFEASKEASKVLYHLGRLSQNQGDYEKALTYYQKYLSDFEVSDLTPQVYLNKGDIYFERKEFEQALESYQKAEGVATPALQVEVHYKIASVFYLQEKFELADAMLRQVIRESDEQVENRRLDDAYFYLTEVLIKLGRRKEALQTISEYKNRFHGRPNAHNILFKQTELFEEHLKDYTRALRAYQEFLETFPQSRHVDEAQVGLGRCYEKLAEYKLALKEYENYLVEYPAGDDFAWVKNRIRLISDAVYLEDAKGISQVSNLLGKFNEAQRTENWTFELGKFFFEIKDFGHAVAEFKKILESSGNGVDRTGALYFLGLAYFRMAEKALLKNDPKESAYLDSAAVYLRQLNENNSDVARLEEAEYLLARIELDTLASIESKQTRLQEYHTSWQKKFSNGEYLDFILIQLADSYFDTNGKKDTAYVKTALTYYEKIKNNHPESEYVEKAHFGSAAAFSYLSEDSTALESITTFVAKYPKSEFIAESLLLKAKLERKMGDVDAAVKDLERIESEFFYSPVVRRARLELADFKFESGEYQSALDIYQNVEDLIESAAKNGVGLGYRKALAYEKLGKDSKALEAYVLFIHENPNHPRIAEATLAVARIAQKQKRLTFAKEYYRNILMHASHARYKFEANSALGDIFFEQGLNSDAQTHYLAALQFADEVRQQKYPESQAIRCQIKQKRFAEADRAIKKFKKKYKDSKDEAQFLLEKANVYLADKDFELAEKTFKKLKGDYKNTEFGAQGEFGLGAVYLISKHAEEALKILTDIPSKYPDSEVTPLTYFNLGDFYYKSRQVENALSAFKQVIVHPRAGDYGRKAHLYLIQCYKDLRLWDQAIATTREYLDKYPHSKTSFRRKIDLAQFLMNLKEYHRAIAEFRKLLPFADEDSEAEIQFYIAQSYSEMGDFERATSEYLKVKYLTKPSRLPWHVTALFEAGKCLTRLNKIEAAKAIFQRIIKEEGGQSNFGRFAQRQLDDLTSRSSITSEN